MISYLGKEENPYEEIFSKMDKLLNIFIEEVKKKSNEIL
jgi:ribonuclease P protein component